MLKQPLIKTTNGNHFIDLISTANAFSSLFLLPIIKSNAIKVVNGKIICTNKKLLHIL